MVISLHTETERWRGFLTLGDSNLKKGMDFDLRNCPRDPGELHKYIIKWEGAWWVRIEMANLACGQDAIFIFFIFIFSCSCFSSHFPRKTIRNQKIEDSVI